MNNTNTQSMLRMGTLIHGGVYRIESYLASGGFGNTYVVRNVEFDEVYALKEFYIKGVCQRDEDSTSISVSNAENTQCFTQQREKFKKEARRIRSLNNEHIVKVHDLFEENGTAYYVMDLVDGESLASRLKRTNKPLTEAEVNNLLPQILDGLQAIHAMGIWHLDIKPANIMVDKHGVVKLIDFGASKQQSSAGGASMSTGISYTNGYAPSEQMAQEYEEFGSWTDFYALGATLYKLLTLQNPPSVTKVADDETPDKHIALPMSRVSDKMKLLIVWMMQDKRKHRPQSAAEIMEGLHRGTPPLDEETTVFAEEDKDSENTVINQPKRHKISNGTNIGQSDNFTRTRTRPVVKKKTADKKSHRGFYVLLAVILIGAGVVWALTSQKVGVAQGASYSNSVLTVNGVRYELVRVNAGTFTMGATSEMKEPWEYEKPTHQVTLTKDYYMGKTEVTQALWKAVMGNNPSNFKGDNKPVEYISWSDCQTFITKLNAATGKNFRLPTEAEWEFAARGGNLSNHYQYSGSNNINDVAWYTNNSGNQTHDVATKQPNELGLYDMSGNVWEWCHDWYNVYESSDQVNPTGPENGLVRVYRGGGWGYVARYCRSSNRPYNLVLPVRSFNVGFRLCLSE